MSPPLYQRYALGRAIKIPFISHDTPASRADDQLNIFIDFAPITAGP
jgi:hypothetical protein